MFPRNSTKVPGLLERIERTLRDGQRAARARAATFPAVAASAPHGADSHLLLRAHADALDTFASGFPTYAPLLCRIQTELDAAVDRGVAAARDMIALRAAVRKARADREAAVTRARQQVSSEPSLLEPRHI